MLISRCYGCESDTIGSRPLPNLSEEISKIRDTAVKHGALQVILAAMSNFPNNKLVQSSGCAALCSFSPRKPVAVHMVIELDGVCHLVAAMKRFPNCAKIQKPACSALSYLSLFEECREPIIQAGVSLTHSR